jgi:AcrR family transcriptional regulator
MDEGRAPVSKGDRRRKAIIEAAITVFADQGYEGASIREIAILADMNKGNLYYYFPAKDDLLFQIVDDLHTEYNESFLAWADTGGTAQDRLRSIFVGHAALVCQRRKQTRITYENFRFLSDARRQEVIKKRDHYEAQISEAIQDYVDSIRPGVKQAQVRLETRAVLGMLNWIYEWYSPGGAISQAVISSRIAEMALRSLGQTAP